MSRIAVFFLYGLLSIKEDRWKILFVEFLDEDDDENDLDSVTVIESHNLQQTYPDTSEVAHLDFMKCITNSLNYPQMRRRSAESV